MLDSSKLRFEVNKGHYVKLFHNAHIEKHCFSICCPTARSRSAHATHSTASRTSVRSAIPRSATAPLKTPRMLRTPLLRVPPCAPQFRAPQPLRYPLRAHCALRDGALRFAPRDPIENTYKAKNVFLRLKITPLDFQWEKNIFCRCSADAPQRLRYLPTNLARWEFFCEKSRESALRALNQK